MDIIKSSGEKEKFSEEKIRESLRRAGAEQEAADRVLKEIKGKLRPEISTESIERHAATCLKRENPLAAARYNLKRALFELGPTGYPFEKYVAQVLEQYGYSAQVGRYVRGKCVRHEVDIIAEKDNESFMIECKYHNRGGLKSDVKVAMYTYARFLDLRRKFDRAWLVTNTKCTSQAIQYAKCAGLKIISWRYPKGESLEQLIERKGLYPVTVLHLPYDAKRRLIENTIVLVGDLARRSPQRIASIAGLKLHIARRLHEQAQSLCLP